MALQAVCLSWCRTTISSLVIKCAESSAHRIRTQLASPGSFLALTRKVAHSPPRCGACVRDRLGLLVALQEAGCPRLSVLHGRCFDGRCRLRPIRPLAWARRNDRYRGSPLPVPSEHLSPQEGLSPWHRGCCRLCRAPSHCLPAHPLTVSRGSRGAPLAHLHGADVGCAHARVPDCFVSMIGSGGRFCCPFRCDAPSRRAFRSVCWTTIRRLWPAHVLSFLSGRGRWRAARKDLCIRITQQLSWLARAAHPAHVRAAALGLL
ncbi:hypothetical protein ACCO45_011811 [Purpureocillium lilacinum]|uniref:Uncharacterized protein n=1 Tax=Purpureocillium lilacinum TaxID=33203 RepID=A0ACC4DEU5_PURLI